MGLDALNKLYEKYSASEKKFEGMSRVQIPKKSGGTINFFKYKNGTFSLQRSGEKGFFYDKNGRLTGVWTDYDPKTNTYMKDILPDIRKRQIEHLAKPEVQQRIKEKNIKIKPKIKAKVDKLLAGKNVAGRWGLAIAGLLAVGYGIYALNKSKDDSTTPVEAVKLTTPIITPEAEEKAAAERTEAERIAEAEEKAAAEKTEAERIAEAEREAAAEKAEEEKAAAQYTTRIVQNGETLTSLAEKYNVSVEKIKELNQDKLRKDAYFLVGTEITLSDSANACNDCKESEETIQDYIDMIVAKHRANPFTQQQLDKYLDRAHQRQYNLQPKAA